MNDQSKDDEYSLLLIECHWITDIGSISQSMGEAEGAEFGDGLETSNGSISNFDSKRYR